MDTKIFGQRLRKLREAKGLSREEFCQDEAELTVRQLMRIETGASKPTLTKIQFMAQRLGLTLFQLMPDYVDVPSEYQRLKYEVIRVPDYRNQSLIDTRDEALTRIYDEYYDELPLQEQLSVDVIRSIFDVRDTRTTEFGQEILHSHFHDVCEKDIFNVNDLLIIRLFVEHFRLNLTKGRSEHTDVFLNVIKRLIAHKDVFLHEEVFVLRDLLFVIIGTAGDAKLHEEIPDLIDCLSYIMQKTQDFQKMPILKLVKWKYEWMVRQDRDTAQKEYESAISFAQMIGDDHLISMLHKEWEEDCSQG